MIQTLDLIDPRTHAEQRYAAAAVRASNLCPSAGCAAMLDAATLSWNADWIELLTAAKLLEEQAQLSIDCGDHGVEPNTWDPAGIGHPLPVLDRPAPSDRKTQCYSCSARPARFVEVFGWEGENQVDPVIGYYCGECRRQR